LLKHIPNALTLLRLILAPVIAWCFWFGTAATGYSQHGWSEADQLQMKLFTTLAAILFVVAALTDFFDGMAARAFNAHSKFGRVIDPIADKALVGLPLIAIVLAEINGVGGRFLFIAPAAAVIVLRDVAMTVIRLAAPDGEGARVSSLAKWKTALELFAVGVYLIGVAIDFNFTTLTNESIDALIVFMRVTEWAAWLWVLLIVITAALSAYTAWQYLAPVKKPAS